MGPITLIGFMGSGKTTVARQLAKKLNLNCIDLDSKIEQAANAKISEIFESGGEEVFRALETQTLSELPGGRYILSLGGGAVMASENVDQLNKRDSTIVYLQTGKEEINRRLARSYKSRPLLTSPGGVGAFISKALTTREPIYEKVANIIIKTDNLTVDQVVDLIIERLKDFKEPQ